MDDYLEVILKLAEGADSATVKEWLLQRGLTTLPMLNGLLIMGSRQQLESAFGAMQQELAKSTSLAIPSELAPYVRSIQLPQPRTY